MSEKKGKKENNGNKFKHFLAYMGGSMFQITLDNPVTAYRQLLQQYSKDPSGKIVSPSLALQEARRVFRSSPLSASLSGLTPRLVGTSVKSAPKFGFMWGITALTGKKEPGVAAAVGASVFSAYCINPIRMIEKQQRIELRAKGVVKPVLEILREAQKYGFRPLFRGTTPLIGHSAASATMGLIGQPKLQKYIRELLLENKEKDKKSDNFRDNFLSFSKSGANLAASALVSPIYVVVTNPLSRLEVIMQTHSIHCAPITLRNAVKELVEDSKTFGWRGVFRGQGTGIVKAVISLSLFHEGRMMMEHLLGL